MSTLAGMAVKGVLPPIVVPADKLVGSWEAPMEEEVVNTLAGIVVNGTDPPMVVVEGKATVPEAENLTGT